MTRKWQDRMDTGGHATKSERRATSENQGRKRPHVSSYRKDEPLRSQEQATGQALLDAWYESLDPSQRGRTGNSR